LNYYLLFFIKVKTELREVSADERTIFNDDFNQHIFEMVSSSDSNEKIGGILAICKYLININ
jgi:FKBP12-rapamycin complex-associated protein